MSSADLLTSVRGYKTQADALNILRNRTFRGSRYSASEIQTAVRVVREMDPNHPLLRYSERGPLRSYPSE